MQTQDKLDRTFLDTHEQLQERATENLQHEIDPTESTTGGGGGRNPSNPGSVENYVFYTQYQYRGYTFSIDKYNDTATHSRQFLWYRSKVFGTYVYADDETSIRSKIRDAADAYIDTRKDGTGTPDDGSDTPGGDGDGGDDGDDDDNKHLPSWEDIMSMLTDLFGYFNDTSKDSDNFLNDWLHIFKTFFGDKSPFSGISDSDRREFVTMMWQALYDFKLKEYQNNYSQYVWYLQNEYNNPQNQAARLAAAGLFNGFSFNSQASGNATQSAGVAEYQAPQAYTDESSELNEQHRANTFNAISSIFGGVASLAGAAQSLGQLSLTGAQKYLLQQQGTATKNQAKLFDRQAFQAMVNSAHTVWTEAFQTQQLHQADTHFRLGLNKDYFNIWQTAQNMKYQSDNALLGTRETNETNMRIGKMNYQLGLKQLEQQNRQFLDNLYKEYDQFGIQGIAAILPQLMSSLEESTTTMNTRSFSWWDLNRDQGGLRLNIPQGPQLAGVGGLPSAPSGGGLMPSFPRLYPYAPGNAPSPSPSQQGPGISIDGANGGWSSAHQKGGERSSSKSNVNSYKFRVMPHNMLPLLDFFTNIKQHVPVLSATPEERQAFNNCSLFSNKLQSIYLQQRPLYETMQYMDMFNSTLAE